MVEVLVLGLAAYRLTRLVVVDDIFNRPRDATLAWLDGHGVGWVTTLLSCSWCVGVWVSSVVYAAWVSAVDPDSRPFVAHATIVLAVAAVQGLLHTVEGDE